MNRTFSKMLIIVVLIILVGGGILAWQYLSQQVEEVKDETVGWQTYRNEEWGFELKYPASGSWKAEKTIMKEAIIEVLLSSDEYRNFSKQCEGRGESSSQCLSGIIILKSGIDPDFIVKDYEPLSDLGAKVLTQAAYVPALKIGIPSKREWNTFITFYLYDRYGKDGKRMPEDKEVFEKILSTFKFIEEGDETASWQTYRNDKYGFTIKYPSNFYIYTIKNPDSHQLTFQDALRGENPELIIQVYVYEGFDSIDEWIADRFQFLKDRGSISKEEVNVGDEKGYKVIFTSGDILPIDDVEVVLIKNGNAYLLYPYTPRLLGWLGKTFKQMVNTFQFLE